MSLDGFPEVSGKSSHRSFPLMADEPAQIFYDPSDFKVVGISATMLSDDEARVTGVRPSVTTASSLAGIPASPAVVVGTAGHSALTDALVEAGALDISELEGKWESYIVQTLKHPEHGTPLLVIAGSAFAQSAGFGFQQGIHP